MVPNTNRNLTVGKLPSDFLAWGDTLKSSWFGKRNGILGWKLGDLPEGQGTAS